MIKAIPYLALATALIFTAGWVQGHKAHSAEMGYKTSLTPIYEQYSHAAKPKTKPVELAKGSRIPVSQIAEYLPPISYAQLIIPVNGK